MCRSSAKSGYRQIVRRIDRKQKTMFFFIFFIEFRYGLAGSANTTGDDQKKLDVLANELFINMLKSSYTVYAMASEENENLIEVETPKQVRKQNISIASSVTVNEKLVDLGQICHLF